MNIKKSKVGSNDNRCTHLLLFAMSFLCSFSLLCLHNTDCADVETVLRIFQSVPSKKAEPVKQWFAKVGYYEKKKLLF